MKKINSQCVRYSLMQVADLLVGGAGAGHTETAHCLLVAGADPDCVVTCSGNTALHAAAEVSARHPPYFYICNHPSTLDYHPSDRYNPAFSCPVCLQGDQLEVARLLLDFGADTQITNK